MCQEVPKTTLRVSDSLGELKATIDHRKRLQSEISKGKRHMGQSLGKTRYELQESCPRIVT